MSLFALDATPSVSSTESETFESRERNVPRGTLYFPDAPTIPEKGNQAILADFEDISEP